MMEKNKGRLKARFILAGLCVALSACGGGSSTTRPPVAPPPPPPAPPPPPPPENFDTQEFRRSDGLSNINAIAAFDAGGTGAGIIVGTIDTGIDLEHPELINNISPDSIDIVANRDNRTVDDPDGHGTLVAGIIAAERNDVGTMGVAFESTILAVRADDPGSCGSEDDCTFFDDDIAEGIRHAARNGARVINISLGGEGFGPDILQAVREAAAQDVLIIISAGNDGEVDPSGFAFLADDPFAREHVLVVGATDSSDQLADFSNRAGQLADVFLVAPGDGILAPFPQDQCDPGPGTCLARASGTSFAAPHVAGAAALLAQMFPNLSGLEIGQILRETARDLGAPGVDAEFGFGLLDLAAAIQPVGTTSVPTDPEAKRTQAADDTGIASSAAFGDAFAASKALDGILMIDKFRRSFRIDGAKTIDRAPAALALQSLVNRPRQIAGRDVALGADTRFSFSAYDDQFAEARANLSSHAAAIENSPRPIAYLSGRIDEKSSAALAYGFSPARLLNRGDAPDPADDFALSARIDTPFFAFSDKTETLAIDRRLSRHVTLDVALARAHEEGDTRQAFAPDRTSLDTRTAIAQLGIELGATRLRFQAGNQTEDGAFLGTRTSGAFALGEGARSTFMALDAVVPFGSGIEGFGRYLTGTTSLSGATSSLVSGIGRLRTESFAFGLRGRDILTARDRMGFAVIQPLRVSGGSASLRVPVDRDFDADIFLFEDRTLSLSPSGREIDLEMSYGLMLNAHTHIETSLVQQFEAGHVANGGTITSLLVRLRSRF